MVFITFLNIKNSGKLSPTIAIIKATHVQSGIHFSIKLLIIGIAQAAFEYIGIQAKTANGTANILSALIYFWKNQAGT